MPSRANAALGLCQANAHATREPKCRQRTHDVRHDVDSNSQKELSKRVR